MFPKHFSAIVCTNFFRFCSKKAAASVNHKETKSRNSHRLWSLAMCALLLLTGVPVANAEVAVTQERGRLTGRVLDSSGTQPAPIEGVFVVVINQVSGHSWRDKSKSGGQYSFQLPAGAYRVSVESPARANFARDGKYTELALPRGEFIENVYVEPGRDTTLDIPLAKKDDKTVTPTVPAAKGGADEEPLGYAGSPSVESEPSDRPDRVNFRDRWRAGFPEYDRYGSVSGGRDIPFRKGRWYNPYDQSVIKGDFPIFGQDIFLILTGISTFTAQQQRTPIPSNLSSARPGSNEFFGKPEILGLNNLLQFSVEMFSGQSTFRPRTWAFKISPTLSVPNYVRARENSIINIDPRRGTNRTDTHFSFEDAFVELKLDEVNKNFDVISVRAGIQPFVSDFRGFIYTDNNLGMRVFGAFDNNRYNYNFAYFAQLEKDTNSNLNRFDRRRQNVYIANIFRQDFLMKGYTGQLSFHFNDDRAGIEYDRNGFQVRPAIIGDARPHAIKVGYIGFSGDGHLGRINLTNSYYFALGTDSRNPIAGKKTRIKAHMAVAEASIDYDFQRFRATAFFASGDPDPTDDRANGFDAILDDPNIIGGQFSFWNRVGIPLTGAAVGLVQPLSVLPTLRSSKTQGQANFVNPGIFIFNVGYDAEVTQRIKAIFNYNYLRFHRTESLEYLLFQNRIRHEIGHDLSVGVAYRPLLINNVQFTFGASMLKPGRGFRDIYTDRTRNCPENVIDFCTPDGVNINPAKPLYALFGQVKFTF